MVAGVGNEGAGLDTQFSRLTSKNNTRIGQLRAQDLVRDIAQHLAIPITQLGNGNGEREQTLNRLQDAAPSRTLQNLLKSLQDLARVQPDAVIGALEQRPDVARALFGAMPQPERDAGP